MKRKRDPKGDTPDDACLEKKAKHDRAGYCSMCATKEDCILYHTVWFRVDVNYMATVYRKQNRKKIVPFVVSNPAVCAEGPWGYNYVTESDGIKTAESIRLNIGPYDKHDGVVGDCFDESQPTSKLYFRRKLSILEMRLIHGCLLPSTIRKIVFDSDLGDVIERYTGVANLIWEYADPSKRRFSCLETQARNGTLSTWDVSKYDSAVWCDLDVNDEDALASGDCVFDLTQWKSAIFE